MINVKARLDIVTRINVPGGWIDNRKNLPLKIDSIFEISGFKRNATTEVYTWRFLTYEDIEERWKDDRQQYLRFQIYAVDSLSNFANVFIRDFFTRRCIKEGDFEFGKSLIVK